MPCCSSWKTASVGVVAATQHDVRRKRWSKNGDRIDHPRSLDNNRLSQFSSCYKPVVLATKRRSKDVLRPTRGNEFQVSHPGTSMCRKRWWRGGSELLVLFMLHHVILGDGDVGCLFSKSLCDPQTETCYNDLAFGRCLPSYTGLSNEDYYQYDFSVDELELLRLQLERLQIDGYKWSHPYTQCVMKTLLYNLKHRKIIDLQLCLLLKEHTHLENNNEIDETRIPTIAIVKFTPDNSKFNNQFAKELYYPPSTQNQYYRDTIYNDDPPRSPYKEQFRETDSQLYKPMYNPNSYNEYDSLTNDEGYDESDSREKPTLGKVNERLYRTRREPWEYNDYKDKNEAIKQYLEMQKRILEDSLTEDESDYDYSDKENRKEGNVDYAKTFSKKYKPKKFNTDSDANEFFFKRGNVKRSSNNYYNAIERFIGDDMELPDNPFDRGEDYHDPLESERELKKWFGELSENFKRRERLDVKKPGPQFSTNNYAFKTEPPSENENGNENESENRSETEQDRDMLTLHEGNSKRGKEEDDNKQVESTNTYDNVDLDHVYVEFQKPFQTWDEGEHVVEEVSKLLELTPGSLKDTRVGRAEVTFKIIDNNKNYDANDVVKNIDKIRDKLKETLGVEVVRAGIGDKTKLPATLEVTKKTEMSSGMFSAIVAAGVAAAVTAAVVTLVIACRHAKARAKLAGLNSDPEASKDYQDLCRARMHAKQPTMDKPESPRITVLSKDGDSNNLPSNRSSTSSWGEEPALSNMDISTGKMVLSYMEDHLQNKDRLDQEWAALCAYEVDPSSTDIAESEANAKKNRPGAPIPYDHSRVILNDFANANNSDYINASTITDHDPRNPAYIATQGPLPHTTADFWQLVWEQGSVVIVMLTRLTEEGVAMCHRYWPEEGSELHHIYEVHLVSEHLWCDDYLVRSFYLKNLHTGETRTVTQFHFLSWPENNVPHSIKALLEFRRKINKSYKGRSCPIVVHCSDGAGRTGTYCLIDMVLNSMMKGAKEIDIAATLEHIRDQRPGMVSTNQQFKFVLMAVAEEVHATLKALPVPPAEKSSLPGNSSSTKEDQ